MIQHFLGLICIGYMFAAGVATRAHHGEGTVDGKDRPATSISGITINFNGPPRMALEFDRVFVEFEEVGYTYDANFVTNDYKPKFAVNFYSTQFPRCGIRVKVIDDSKLRVEGYEKDGKFYPVKRVIIESKQLKKEQLPKIDDPKAKA